VLVYPLLVWCCGLAQQTRSPASPAGQASAHGGREPCDLASGWPAGGGHRAERPGGGQSAQPRTRFRSSPVGPPRLALLLLALIGTTVAFVALWRHQSRISRCLRFHLLGWGDCPGLAARVFRHRRQSARAGLLAIAFWGGAGLTGSENAVLVASRPEIHKHLHWPALAHRHELLGRRWISWPQGWTGAARSAGDSAQLAEAARSSAATSKHAPVPRPRPALRRPKSVNRASNAACGPVRGASSSNGLGERLICPGL